MGDLLSVFAVAPLVGARIEMGHVDKDSGETIVAPHAGARIEMISARSLLCRHPVAPLVGARVEICHSICTSSALLSLPTRERGLKLYAVLDAILLVASLPSWVQRDCTCLYMYYSKIAGTFARKIPAIF